MKLRNIFLSAIALALAASFTACDKDDDNDEQSAASDLDIYQTWEITSDKEFDKEAQNAYFKFTKDSLFAICRFTDSIAGKYGFSTDSVYYTNAMTATSVAVGNADSAMVFCEYDGVPFKFIVKKTDVNGKYILMHIFKPGTSYADTTLYDATVATGLKISDRKLYK